MLLLCYWSRLYLNEQKTAPNPAYTHTHIHCMSEGHYVNHRARTRRHTSEIRKKKENGTLAFYVMISICIRTCNVSQCKNGNTNNIQWQQRARKHTAQHLLNLWKQKRK